jgi:exodeoxyribonuclease VII large subunit
MPVESISTPLSPDLVLGQIQIAHPREALSVKGRVVRLNRWSSKENPSIAYVYGAIRGEKLTLDFKCPSSAAPTKQGEVVVIHGFLIIAKSDPLTIRLDGECVSAGERTEIAARPIFIPRRERTRLSLASLVSAGKTESLAVIGSETGVHDWREAFGQNDGIMIRAATTKIGDREAVLASLDHALSEGGSKAIAFVRGGGDDAGIEIWDDPGFITEILERNVPFYTAVGHASNILLADKFADECFITPSDFGHELGDAIAAAIEKHRVEGESRKAREKAESEVTALTHLLRQKDENVLAALQRHLDEVKASREEAEKLRRQLAEQIGLLSRKDVEILELGKNSKAMRLARNRLLGVLIVVLVLGIVALTLWGLRVP